MDIFVLLIIMVCVSFLIGNIIGYNQGFNECEEITQKTIHKIIEDCEEKKLHKFKEASNTEVEDGKTNFRKEGE